MRVCPRPRVRRKNSIPPSLTVSRCCRLLNGEMGLSQRQFPTYKKCDITPIQLFIYSLSVVMRLQCSRRNSRLQRTRFWKTFYTEYLLGLPAKSLESLVCDNETCGLIHLDKSYELKELDCGIHPGLSGMDALPYTDLVEADEIDLLLVSHFHLDHCGALPWFLEKTTFRGRVFMTHATKAIYRWLLSDYIKVSNISSEQMLYSDDDLERSMEKIETINFHQEAEVNGIKFWCYHAGHVLGAAMFMIEIAGVKTLYTGDFSRQEDRHLMSAEMPNVKPDVLIVESTYGTHIHEKRDVRENRFTNLVHDIVGRGGRCLIPVFALGRAQELLLILDEYWEGHPDLHDTPIYYASALAKKCMAVYQTYVSAMNDKIRRQITINNPFNFKHISNLKSIDHFEDVGPCVVLASPGMMQSGLSRELFESWCMDARNGTIIAGYCVEGTLAKHILTEPEEILTLNGQKLPMKCSVDYISFSAHTDYKQTSGFVRMLKPNHVVLVHGEQNEMARLKAALLLEYEDDTHNMNVYNPRNTQAVNLHFRGEKMAKVIGSLAASGAQHGAKLSGMLVKRNWNYHVMAPRDLSNYTELSVCSLQQRQSLCYTGSKSSLRYYLQQVCGKIKEGKSAEDENATSLSIFDGAVTVLHNDVNKIVIIEWQASPVTDMYADAVLAVILKADATPVDPSLVSSVVNVDKAHFQECLRETLEDMFGKGTVSALVKGGKMAVKIDDTTATIDIDSKEISCPDNVELCQTLTTCVKNLYRAIEPFQSIT